ncbi:uncharacterized protein ACDP82_004490 [Pangshura tecta]
MCQGNTLRGSWMISVEDSPSLQILGLKGTPGSGERMIWKMILPAQVQIGGKEDTIFQEFVLEDISLLRVTWEVMEGLLLQCGFCSGPYAACLCAAMVPPPPHSTKAWTC